MQFADEMKDRDPRLSQSIRGTGYIRVGEKSVESANLLVSSTGYQPIKFVTQKVYQNNEVDRSGRSYNDMPVYRYAEVLLNFAEAKAELGELSQGDLDPVRRQECEPHPQTCRHAGHEDRQQRGSIPDQPGLRLFQLQGRRHT